MKNISQKIFLLSVISFLIIPQVTFAAWWNPFTWNFFHKPTEIKIENIITPPTSVFPPVVEIEQLKADKQAIEIENIKNV
jgi:hypothetical protein